MDDKNHYQGNDYQNGGYSNDDSQNGNYQNSGYSNNDYQSGNDSGSSYPNNDYPNGDYSNSNYQNNGYQNDGYQNGNYQNSSYQNNGYQNDVYQNPNGNQGYGNYQPFQPVYPSNSSADMEEPMSLGEWMLTLLVMIVPCANIVMLFVWAFSKTEKKSKSNFCKAYLIYIGIIFAIYLLIIILAAIIVAAAA